MTKIVLNDNLNKYIGKTACVFVSEKGNERNVFCTQVCVQGVLEKHPEKDQYKIVIDDDTYTYFNSKDVIMSIYNPTKERPNIAIKVG